MAVELDRRQFVKASIGGAMIMALGLQAGRISKLVGGSADAAASTSNPSEIVIGEAMVEMVDLVPVYCWTFGTPAGPEFPGPMLHAIEGDSITLKITNTLDEDHAFAIQGTSVNTGPIAPGGSKTITFTAPAAGTYIYLDPLNAPVNRLLGLCGTLVVLPANVGKNPYGSNNTPQTTQLFNDLGTTSHFPGESWTVDRTRVWHVHSIDPKWNTLAMNGTTVDPAKMTSGELPRYFLINGKSGFFASHDHNIAPSARVGQPFLIRILNTGTNTCSLHIHGNHVYVTARSGPGVDRQGPQTHVPWIDSWGVHPLQTADWVLPYIYPPDIPKAPSGLLRDGMKGELAWHDAYGIQLSPVCYPMHCHMEPSQTAGGGNYPGGLVTHWEITGDVDGVDFPNVTAATTSTVSHA